MGQELASQGEGGPHGGSRYDRPSVLGCSSRRPVELVAASLGFPGLQKRSFGIWHLGRAYAEA